MFSSFKIFWLYQMPVEPVSFGMPYSLPPMVSGCKVRGAKFFRMSLGTYGVMSAANPLRTNSGVSAAVPKITSGMPEPARRAKRTFSLIDPGT
jgi:hypothetical protein